jgi:pre-rRNA-processing protein TSR3
VRTFILYHPKERLSKCTLRPLWGRDGFTITTWPNTDVIPEDVLLLHPDGKPITTADAGRAILLVDGTWRQALKMGKHLTHFEYRSIPNFRTAFPRKSKVFTDPDGGLASSEALFCAALLMGEHDESWLEGYYWREEFLARNKDYIEELIESGGLAPEAEAEDDAA